MNEDHATWILLALLGLVVTGFVVAMGVVLGVLRSVLRTVLRAVLPRRRAHRADAPVRHARRTGASTSLPATRPMPLIVDHHGDHDSDDRSHDSIDPGEHEPREACHEA